MNLKWAIKGLYVGYVFATLMPMLNYYLDNPKYAIYGTLLFVSGCLKGYLLESLPNENENNNSDKKGE